MALVNRYVLLRYDVGGPVLWHERWALEHVSGETYVVVTPDRDVYAEDLGLLNDDLVGIRVRGAPGAIPAGVNAASIYALPVWNAAEIQAIRDEARVVATQERQAAGVAPGPAIAPAAGVAAPAVAAAAGQQPVLGPQPHAFGVLKWLAAEKAGDYNYGDPVAGVALALSRGAKAVHVERGMSIFVECVDGADFIEFLARPSHCDSRILPVALNALQQPERTLKEVASSMCEIPVKWVLTGPRTSKWCINYLSIEGLGFEGHHERLRQVTRADSSSWGIQEHFQISVSVRQALLVDQLDGCNLLSIEVQFRRLQTIEYSYAEKAREQEARSVGGRLSLEEQTTFGGVTRQYSTLMVRAQLQALEFIEQSVEAQGTPPQLTGPEALEELRVSVGYGELPSSCPLGSFDPALISLPTGEVRPVPLEQLWGTGGQQVVEDFSSAQVLGSDAVESRREACGGVRVYNDPKLNDPVQYGGFVKRLCELNLAEFRLEPQDEEVGLFFVKKKGNRLRMIMDCRKSNLHFSEPAPVELATGDALSKLELGDGATLHMASADLANAFYTMQLPEEWRRFFGFRRVRAKHVGITELSGNAIKPDTWLYPRSLVIPMGWAWALYWCQRVNERICERSGLSAECRVRDGYPPPTGSFWHLQYVDNLHVVGTNKAEVESKFWSAVGALRDAGLTVHEIEFNEAAVTMLGWHIEDCGILRPTLKRIWRIRLALRELLSRGRMSGQQLERLVGHMTFVSLCRREALAVMGEVYSFIRRHYPEVVPIWKSVRKELMKFDGICPLIFNNLQSSWSDTVYAVDASEWGLGVVRATVEPSVVGAWGQHLERWRFKDDEAKDARSYVLVEDERNLYAGDGNYASDGCTSHYKTVGFDAVDRDWQVVGRYKWTHHDSMPVYEALATLHAVKHFFRTAGNQRQRLLVLTDSMTAALSFDKGRAHSHRLRRVLEQFSALALVSGVQVSWCTPPRKRKRESQPSVPTRPVQVEPNLLTSWQVELEPLPNVAKKQKRSQVRKLASVQVGGNTLRQNAVGPLTQKKYQRHWELIQRWCYNQITLDMHVVQLDRLMTNYLEHCYLEGEDLSFANYAVAAVMYYIPRTKGLQTLPLVQQSMRGWRRLCPPRARLPIPYEAVCLLSLQAYKERKMEVCLALQLMFLLYLRPGEVFAIRVQDVVQLIQRAGKAYKNFCVLLHPSERGVPSKTKQWDEMIKCEELRKGIQVGSVDGQSKQGHPKQSHQSKKGNRQYLVEQALKPGVSLRVSIFLEIFCGCGRLGKAVQRKCGWPVLLWDISFGPQYDLLQPANQKKILNWIMSGQVRGGHLGTPCHSFSRARDRPGGPPRLRSDQHPMGLTGLRDCDQRKVTEGNKLMRFSTSVLLAAIQLHIPFTLENPRNSRLWLCGSVRNVMRRRATTQVDVTFCAFGTPWKKPTKILGVHVDLGILQPFTCHCSKRGICGHTGKPHIPLMGLHPSGAWMTKIAEPYPLPLCRKLAQVFYNADLAAIAEGFMIHLQAENPVGT
eukprot:Skav230672  [mRNA]  locus=scaffold2185:329965:335309:- [translate_table: standard]